MELLKRINIEYSQYKKYLYKKLTTYTMISIKNKVKSNQVIKDNFVVKINELVEIENKTLKDVKRSAKLGSIKIKKSYI